MLKSYIGLSPRATSSVLGKAAAVSYLVMLKSHIGLSPRATSSVLGKTAAVSYLVMLKSYRPVTTGNQQCRGKAADLYVSCRHCLSDVDCTSE